MLFVQDPNNPTYPHRSLTVQELNIVSKMLKGQVLSEKDGLKSPWNVTKQRIIGTDANPFGPCCVADSSKTVTAAEVGAEIAGRKIWKLHQAAFAFKYHHVPLNKNDDIKVNASRLTETWVIAHDCGREDCSNTDHMSVSHHKDNLIQCRCHAALKKQDRNDRLHRRNKSHALGRDCFWTHNGAQCHYNLSTKQ